MVLNQDFKEFIQSLNANKVRYLIIGGYAVAFHGQPRYTKDLDVWVEPNLRNAVRLIAALEAFGFGSIDLKPNDFLDPEAVIQLGYPPHRIDLVADLKGVDLSTCYDSRIIDKIDGIPMSFIDLENLKRNKKAVGRYQDLADLENLQ